MWKIKNCILFKTQNHIKITFAIIYIKVSQHTDMQSCSCRVAPKERQSNVTTLPSFSLTRVPGVDADLFVFELEILQIELAASVFVLICYKGRRKLFVWILCCSFREFRIYCVYVRVLIPYMYMKLQNKKRVIQHAAFSRQCECNTHQSRTQPIICEAIKDS